MKIRQQAFLMQMCVILATFLTCFSTEGCEQQISDDFWAKSTSASMEEFAVQNQLLGNLQTVLVTFPGGTGAILTLVRRDLLPDGQPATNIVITDIQSVIDFLFPTKTSLGEASSDLFALLNYPAALGPVPPVSNDEFSTDLIAIRDQIFFGQPDLGTAVTGLWNLIDLLNSPMPAPVFYTLNYAVSRVKDTIDSAQATLGIAVTSAKNKIDVPNLTVPDGDPALVSTNKIVDDLALAVDTIRDGSMGTLGEAVDYVMTTKINLPAIPQTQPHLAPVMPAGPASVTTGKIDTEIEAIIQKIKPGAASLGEALEFCLDRLNNYARFNLGDPNGSAPYESIFAFLDYHGYGI